MATGTLPDSDQEKIVSSNESDELFHDTYGDDVARGIDEAEKHAATGGADKDKPLGDKEEDPNAPPGGWHNGVVAGGNRGKKAMPWTRMSRNKKWFLGVGLSGVGISIPLILLSLLPLRLEMMIQNITGLASEVPQYAIKQRTEYIVTRALAARLLGAANNSIDSKLIFCKGAGIACSLFSTYSGDYFDKKYGIKIGNVEANGRTSLGGKAKSWEISVGKNDTDIDGLVKKISYDSNGDMKKFIFRELDKEKIPNIVDRFLVRRLLMKKFGVSTWRGPKAVEKGVNKLKTIRINLKTSIAKNTWYKIAPRVTTYIVCLTDPAVCSNLRELNASKTPTSIKDPATDPDLKDMDRNSEDYKSRVKAYERDIEVQKKVGNVSVSPDDAVGKDAAKKMITKRILASVGGVAAAAEILNLVFSAVHAVDKGALSEIQYDITSQVYTGFSTEIQTANEQMKAGDGDIDTLGVLNSYFDSGNTTSSDTVSAASVLNDGLESSPLYQAENGQTVDTSSGVTIPCDDENGNKVNTKLDPGEYVCPDQKAVRNLAPFFSTDPVGKVIAGIADVWVGSIGVVFKTAGDALGAILNALPGVSQLMTAVGNLFAGGIEGMTNWLIGLISHTPSVGPDASPSDNYAAVSGGLRIAQNALMEEGVDNEGNAMGGGGSVQSKANVALITEEQNKANKDIFDSKPLMARIFDASLTGSFVQQFVSRIPFSVGGVAKLPFASFTQLFSHASAATAPINPFGLPIYGYGPNDPALTADPGTYDEAFCAQSAQDRIDSHKKEEGDIIAVYHKSDPCALEKMVVGSQLEAAGVTDDTYSLKPVTAETGGALISGGNMQKPDVTTPRGNGWTLSPGVDYTKYACDSRTKDIGVYKNPNLGFTVRLCEVTNFPSSSGVNLGKGSSNVVASVISTNVENMFSDAKAAGISLGVSDGMRSIDNPDYSNFSQHGRGLAIDIGSPRGGQTICFTKGGFSSIAAAESACSGNAPYAWLKANAAKYGFQNLMNTLHEPWHWSMGEF